MFAAEGTGRLASRRARRRVVQTCGVEAGDEARRDHSAMQSLVLGER